MRTAIEPNKPILETVTSSPSGVQAKITPLGIDFDLHATYFVMCQEEWEQFKQKIDEGFEKIKAYHEHFSEVNYGEGEIQS